jgi:Tfp pilus assembly protein PilO
VDAQTVVLIIQGILGILVGFGLMMLQEIKQRQTNHSHDIHNLRDQLQPVVTRLAVIEALRDERDHLRQDLHDAINALGSQQKSNAGGS